MAPIVGAVGVSGCGLITTLLVGNDEHPLALLAVKLYVPAANPVKVLLAEVPVTPPGLIVQLPTGKLLSITLPVARVQVG
jgi:hypothetical protein